MPNLLPLHRDSHDELPGAVPPSAELRSERRAQPEPPVLSRTSRTLKRGLDVVGAGAALVVLLPVMLLIAAAIRLSALGPALVREERVGRGGRTFEIVRFRSAPRDSRDVLEHVLQHGAHPSWSRTADPGGPLPLVGRALRATGLDELPRLWNVVRGQMSLVGPAPLSVRDDSRAGGRADGRLDLTPGLVGRWPAADRRSVPLDDLVELDRSYVGDWSLRGDAALVLETLPAVFTGRSPR